MKKIIFITFLTTLTLTQLGCDDLQKASEKNFEVSIQRFLDARYPACVVMQNFPADTWNLMLGNKPEMFDELVKLGLLSRVDEMKKRNQYTKLERLATYSMTADGQKYYQQDAGKNMLGGAVGGFCFGKATVNEIVDFTQPSEMMGTTYSRVNFTYTVSDLPDWVKTPALSNLNEKIKGLVEAAETPVKGKADMILTNKGWKHSQQDGLDEAKERVKK